MNSLGYFYRDVGSSKGPPQARNALYARFAMPCADRLNETPAQGQTLTPDLMRPVRDGFVRRRIRGCAGPMTRPATVANDIAGDDDSFATGTLRRRRESDRFRTYGLPPPAAHPTPATIAQSHAQAAQTYPGQAKLKPPPGPGSPDRRHPACDFERTNQAVCSAVRDRQQDADPAGDGRHGGGSAAQALEVDDDPFGAVGDYAGSFLIKSALELRSGYDTNPGRTYVPKGSPLYAVAPEFLAVSDWERHALVADLRGSFTGYTNNLPAARADGTISSAPTNLDRPDFNGHIDGRLDVTATPACPPVRLRVATDNPGSPNIQAGLAKYPLYSTLGGTLGVDQSFNRLQLSAGGTVDRTAYTEVKTHRRHHDHQ